MSSRTAAIAGLFAAAWFWCLLLVFAAVRSDGYSHLTKAVSELGSVGAPNGLAWNLSGFGLTGAALALFGWGLGQAAEPGRRFVSGWLAASGLAFALSAVPADMEALGAPSSLTHIAAALLVFVCWLPAAWRLARRGGAWRGLARASAAALWASLAAAAVRGAELLPPGAGQRLSFAVYFAWVAAASVLLLQRTADPRPRMSASP